MQLTVLEALADFESTIVTAANGPVQIEADRKVVAVLVSPKHYEAVTAGVSHIPKAGLERLMAASIERHGSIYRALAKWESKNEPPET